MTTEEKYNELLKELAEALKSKNDKIKMQGYLIEDLKNKLAAAEAQINEKAGCKK